MGDSSSLGRRLPATILAVVAVVGLAACSSRGQQPPARQVTQARPAVVAAPESDALVFIGSGGAGRARVYDEKFDGWVDIAVADRYASASGRSCARFEAWPNRAGSLKGGTWYACEGSQGWYLVDIR